jgi:hydroxymethylpyrimidine pyrophosphatase-like HAD family hydrolase
MTISIGENKDTPEALMTEDKKVMPNENDYKKECVDKLTEVQDELKQEAQEDVKDVVTYIQMAIDVLSGNGDKAQAEKDVQDMTDTKKKDMMDMAEED